MSINDDILYKIDSEIGKDKKVVELQREIERLNQEIRGLNNCIIKFHSEFCNKQAEINRLNNIINELEIDIENRIYMIEPKGTHINFNDCDYECEEDYINGVETRTELDVLKYILNKLQELKGVNKE